MPFLAMSVAISLERCLHGVATSIGCAKAWANDIAKDVAKDIAKEIAKKDIATTQVSVPARRTSSASSYALLS